MSVFGRVRSVVGVVREENVPFMAAGIAYYAVVSVVPLAVLTLALLSLFGGVDAAVSLARAYLDGTPERALEAVLTTSRGRDLAGTVGSVFLLWSAIKVFRGLSVAFAEIYDEESDLTLVDQVLRSLAVMVVLLVSLSVLAATSLVLGFGQLHVAFPTLVGNAAAFFVLVVALLPIFHYLPPRTVTITHALPGAVFTALGWVVLQVAFFYYARFAGESVAYGLFGGVFLFVTVLYVAAIVLLVGVAFNAASERPTPQ